MRKVRIAQIGLGHDHAPGAYRALRRLSGEFELLGIAEPDEAYRDRITWPEYGGAQLQPVDALLAMRPDAVAIETAEEQAAPIAQRCADLGIAVYLDKPGAMTCAEFDRVADTLEQKHLPLQLGYMYRYNPAIRRALAAVQRGELGEIYAVEAHMDIFHDTAKRQWESKFPGGMMYFLGCHLIDLIYQIQGEPDEVIPLNRSTGIDGVTADDFGLVLLRYPHGVSFAKTCSAEVDGFNRRQLVICGTRGTIEIRPTEIWAADNPVHYGAPLTARWKETFVSPEEKAWYDGGARGETALFDRYEPMLRDFARMVRGETVNPYSYDYERRLFRLVLRCCGAEK